MGDVRDTLFEWARTGALPAARLPAALHLAGAAPDGSAWLRFLTRFVFGLGAVLVASGAIYFVAFNWHELSRFAKFALVEASIVLAIAVVWRAGPQTVVGQSALVAAALCTGALLALVGQVYQTGADTHELFVAWALAILPWAVLGSVPALWLLWLGIVNVAVGLYFQTFPGLFGVVFGPRELMWWLFFVNTFAWVAWELLARRNVRGFDAEWAKRTVAFASGACITVIALVAIVDRRSGFAIALLVAAPGTASSGGSIACARSICSSWPGRCCRW